MSKTRGRSAAGIARAPWDDSDRQLDGFPSDQRWHHPFFSNRVPRRRQLEDRQRHIEQRPTSSIRDGKLAAHRLSRRHAVGPIAADRHAHPTQHRTDSRCDQYQHPQRDGNLINRHLFRDHTRQSRDGQRRHHHFARRSERVHPEKNSTPGNGRSRNMARSAIIGRRKPKTNLPNQLRVGRGDSAVAAVD